MNDFPSPPLWSDNPTSEDLLGFGDVAEPIIEALGREQLDPVAIGISGDWGSGKTTILEIIADRLPEDTVVVFTRPWEYDPVTDPKATLIAEVLAKVEERATANAGGTLSDELKGRFASLAKRVKWSKAIRLAASSAVTLSPPRFDEVIDIFGKEDEPATDPTLQGFREQFRELMTDLDSVSQVVVLVDDLDRCLPESVVGTLEAVKLFLSVEKMGFVIAADQRLVTHAIATRYESAAQADRMSLQYLEKIVQIPIRVPALGESDAEAYLVLLLVHRHLEGDDEPEPDGNGERPPTRYRQIIDHCASQRANAAERVLDDLPDGLIPGEADDDLKLARQLASALATPLGGNPRRLKRFMNAYWLRLDIAKRRGAALEGPVLAKLLVLEQTNPEQFDVILKWSRQGRLKEQLSKLEATEGENTLDASEKALSVWAQAGPPLVELELDRYLRLAASLRSLPGGPSELRPDLQAVLDGLTDEAAVRRREAQDKLATMPEADRIQLVKEAVRMIIAERGKQADIAESLAKLGGDPAVAAEMGAVLKDLDASLIEAALIIRLQSLAGMTEVINGWLASDRLDHQATEAAKAAIEEAGQG